MSRNITELVCVFYFHFVLKLQQDVLHNCRERQDFPIFNCVCQFTSQIFLPLDVNLDDFLPHMEWSHMHVLKPEEINITRKNIQNVLTNIKNIYIYLYIYIRAIPGEWEDIYAQTKLP